MLFWFLVKVYIKALGSLSCLLTVQFDFFSENVGHDKATEV